jgi:hypothetical protein
MIESEDELEKDSPHVLHFRLLLEVGTAVEQFLPLMAAASRPVGAISTHLEQLSSQLIDSHSHSFASLSYLEQIEIIKQQVEVEKKSQPHFRDFYDRIAADLRGTGISEARQRIQFMDDEAFRCVAEVLTKHGGHLTSYRWAQCRPAKIHFGQSHQTVLTFKSNSATPTGTITVYIGQQEEALRIYFCLSFFFFHEYFSHGFPVWDSSNKLLSDGILVAVASFLLNRDFPNVIRKHFVRKTFEVSARVRLRSVEEATEWYLETVGLPFVRCILEWAATVPPQKNANNADVDRLLQLPGLVARSRRFASVVRDAFSSPGTWLSSLQDVENKILLSVSPVESYRSPLT